MRRNGENHRTVLQIQIHRLASYPTQISELLFPLKETTLNYDTNSSSRYFGTLSSVFAGFFAFDLQAPMKRKKRSFVSFCFSLVETQSPVNTSTPATRSIRRLEKKVQHPLNNWDGVALHRKRCWQVCLNITARCISFTESKKRFRTKG